MESPPERPGEDQKSEYLRRWVGDLHLDASAKDEKLRRLVEWRRGLSGAEIARLYQKQYHPTYLNLLSVFGETLSAGEIQDLAVRCVRATAWSESQFDFHLSKLIAAARSARAGDAVAADGRRWLKLRGWDTALIRALLERGKGLIICTNRFSLMSFVPLELALMGFRTSVVVNRRFTEVMQAALDFLGGAAGGEEAGGGEAGEGAASLRNISRLKVINAEERTGVAKFVDALKGGGIVSLNVEGNTGADGPWGQGSRSAVRFFNHTLRVKNGVARLAAALGTPLLPVTTLSEPDCFGRVVFGTPIIPPRSSSPSDCEGFVRQTMQALYARLESYAGRYRDQWEGWSALHRWRVEDAEGSSPAVPPRNVDAGEVFEILRGGQSFRVNRRRVALLPAEGGSVWVDLKTLKSYMNPAWAGEENILEALSGQDGVNLKWLDRRGDDPGWREKAVRLLSYLSASELIVAC
jgi:hypothetical protein